MLKIIKKVLNVFRRKNTKITTDINENFCNNHSHNELHETRTCKNTPQCQEKVTFYNKCTYFPSSFVILDTETTGFSPSTEHLIQIACIKVVDDVIVETFNEYVKPPIPIPEKIQKLTGITNEMVENSSNIYDIMPKLITFIGNNTIVCHNASFDMSFIQTNLNTINLSLIGNDVLDTLHLARKYIKDVENHKLETLKKHLHIDTPSHNALNDCEVTLKLYQHCKELCENRTPSINIKATQKNEMIELNELEKEYYAITKEIFAENNKDISHLKVSRTSIYFDINAFDYIFLRFKTTKKLKYWLAEATQQEILNIDSNVYIQEGGKDEKKYIRVFLEKPEDLKKFTEIILNRFDQLCVDKQRYDEWVANGKPMHYEAILKINSDKTVTIETRKY